MKLLGNLNQHQHCRKSPGGLVQKGAQTWNHAPTLIINGTCTVLNYQTWVQVALLDSNSCAFLWLLTMQNLTLAVPCVFPPFQRPGLHDIQPHGMGVGHQPGTRRKQVLWG